MDSYYVKFAEAVNTILSNPERENPMPTHDFRERFSEVPIHITPPQIVAPDFVRMHTVAIQDQDSPDNALAYTAAMLRRIENPDIAALGLVLLGCAQAIVRALERLEHPLLIANIQAPEVKTP